MSAKNHLSWAISPLDGRYAEHVADLKETVSEAAFFAYRLRVEAAWLIHLANHPLIAHDLSLPEAIRNRLLEIGSARPEPSTIERIKQIELTTNHDVKAIEYYLREVLQQAKAPAQILAFVHFACTSEDINNLAYGLMLTETKEKHILPLMDALVEELRHKADQLAELPMLSRTHGQAASPTTMGKELAVFAYRLQRQRDQLERIQLLGKMNGSVGNYNAHVVAYPNVDWPRFAQSFVEHLGLAWNPLTTQIESHDSLIEYCDILRRFNGIAIDLARDLWGYISLGYLCPHVDPKEVGSSVMPHKINPISVEQAEGSYGLSSAIATHFADKLPISRFQRDLSDSTVLRSFGTLVGHHILAGKALLRSLQSLRANAKRMQSDVQNAWALLAEPIQTMMRRFGVADAYERLKAATRGHEVTQAMLHKLIDECTELPADIRMQLKQLTPSSYTGLAAALARNLKNGEG